MVNINITNSVCQALSLPKRLDTLLSQELSYLDEGVEFSYQKNLRHIRSLDAMISSGRLSNADGYKAQLRRLLHINNGLARKRFVSLYKDGEFPTGLLPRVLDILTNNKEAYELKDMRKRPKASQRYVLKESLPELRYYQKTASRRLEEAHRGIVVMPTGTGKTVTICKMIWDLQVKTLIVTPSKAITDLMMDTVIKHFGKGKVGKLNTKSKKCDKAINVVNIQALIKMDPKALQDIDAVFIDEFHHSAAETYREVNLKHLKNTFYRIGVTATNFRNDGSDLALESVISEVLYEYGIKQAIEDGYLIRPEFEILDNRSVTHENTYQKEYKANIVENEDRNEWIAELAEKHKDDSVIILIQQVEHGELLKTMIPNAEFLHGMVKDSDRQRIMENFRKGKLKCIIGTTVIGEGVDLPIGNVLIMGGGGKARSQIMQNIGRVLRICKGKDFALVYDFMDRGSRWLHEHSLLRQEIYEIY